jgi:hypothetical protein
MHFEFERFRSLSLTTLVMMQETASVMRMDIALNLIISEYLDLKLALFQRYKVGQLQITRSDMLVEGHTQ